MNSLVFVALKPRDNGMLLLLFLGAVQTLLFQRLLGMAINLPLFPAGLTLQGHSGITSGDLWGHPGASSFVWGLVTH